MIARLLEELNSGKTTERKVAAFPVPSEGNTVEMVDPISALIERRRAVEGAKPAALVALQIEVTINGGLALVETTRSYTNNEAMPIETLLSLPVPVHAAFFGLTARIGGRLHKAVAMAKEEARETYESAIDEGAGPPSCTRSCCGAFMRYRWPTWLPARKPRSRPAGPSRCAFPGLAAACASR